MSSPSNDEPDQPAQPPEVIWPACGAFCDIFWWARRKAETTQAPSPIDPDDKPS
jgi:hypothetical protein